ncbi:MAG: hypothetical protein ICV74_07830 [Thermoleophilia bacterium]|nr:hypothetical protein [Thermoleophilia bacterium]
MRDVVVMLPGITGSVLQKDGKDVWNVSGGSALRALFTLGGAVKELALERDQPEVDDLGDGVSATEVMRDIHLIPGLWKIDGYSKCFRHVTDTFDVERGKNFFEFAYDWRRDNRVAARRLAQESRRWLAEWRRDAGAPDAKLVLVGHSMGGLVARYFLECLDGWRDTRVLVTFGTPYRGSVNAVATLVNGLRKGIGPVGVDLSSLARSFTSIYQLLPIYPCYDGGDGKLVRIAEVAVPNVEREKAEAALEFHREIERAVEGHRDDEEYRERGYAIRPVVGTFQPTSQSARLTGNRVELLRTYDGRDLDGDGTVPRVSATPIEVKDEENAMFAAERHASLQNDDPVLVQLTGILSGIDIDHDRFREALPQIGLALDLDDVYGPEEPVAVRVRPQQPPSQPLVVEVENVETSERTARATLRLGDDGWHAGELGPLAEGTYRLTAFGPGPVEPVTDLFAVIADDGGGPVREPT